MLTAPACKQINKSIDDTLHGSPKVSKEDAFFNHDAVSDAAKPNFLEDAGALAAAEASLHNIPELKGKPIKMFGDMHLYDDGRIMLKVQDPDTLQNVNEYDYDNKQWGPKTPVNTGSVTPDMISRAVIPLDSIHFKYVAKMFKEFTDSAKHYNSTSRLDHIYFVRDVNKWYCSDIAGTRSSYQIYFKPDGTVSEFDKR